jgi:HAMP domain-containing protein
MKEMAESAEGIGPPRPVELIAEVHCGSCGALVASGEQFCTSCGRPVAASDLEESPHQISRRLKLTVLALAVAVAALAAFSAFEFVQYRHEQSRLSNARQELARTRASLSATTAQLTKTKRLSQRQEAILSETASVLKKVDPLLSDADHLQQITGSIQVARDTFASDSAQMTSDLLTLENYEANPQDYPQIDEGGLVALVSNELQTVRARNVVQFTEMCLSHRGGTIYLVHHELRVHVDPDSLDPVIARKLQSLDQRSVLRHVVGGRTDRLRDLSHGD